MTHADQDQSQPDLAGIIDLEGRWIPPEVAASLARAIRIGPGEAPDAGSRALRFTGAQGCLVPDGLADAGGWGITTQLYELHSERSCGIGDFEDLRTLCLIAARAGADFVGITPLHALFQADPGRCSPFSPSNRRFLNPLHIAVDLLPGYGQIAEIDRDARQTLAEASLVDYRAVSDTKLSVLRKLWQHWADSEALAEEHAAFDAFVEEEGRILRDHALFESVSAMMVAEGHGAGWTDWPDEYREPGSEAVRQIAQERAGDIAFHGWLQWVAARQLASVAAAARTAGMRIGLYLDLAVGEAPDGSAAWSDRESYLDGASIGAPPDYFSADGQEWNLTVMTPQAIGAGEGAPFRTLIEHASRSSGALRLDHVMGLWQLFVIPQGLAPRDGAFVRYPVDRLLHALAAASRDGGVIVIGEDLGHVPDGFRDVMAQAGVLSYRILYFEKSGDGGFIAAGDYPPLSIACVSTHDLPTLAGWWRGDDIGLRRDFGLITGEMAERQTWERGEERRRLVQAVAGDGVTTTHDPEAGEDLTQELAVDVHRFLARSRSMLVGVRLADLVGETLPTNLPGTVDQYPNWKRRCRVPLEHLEEEPRFKAITQAVAQVRPRP
ncbi:MAG: 4-alpha-glucanotransferase [Brucellaceae bacterium]|nr:4-alpha-glucanotransferase [Brucellaceae bacterium]